MALLSAHFTMTLIFVSPHNGLRLTTIPYVERWIEPYFYQKWTLFAPEPLKSTDYLLVQCRVRLAVSGGHFDTDVVDVSSPLYRAHQADRLGAAGRILRAQAYPLFVFAGKRPELVEYLLQDPPEAQLHPDVAKLVERTQTAEAGARKEATARIARIGSAECDRMFPDAHQIVATHVIWKSLDPPAFSERNSPGATGEANYTDLGWLDYVQVSRWR